MLEVLPPEDVSFDATRPFRIAVIAHIPDASLAPICWARSQRVGQPSSLFVTTNDEDSARVIEDILDRISSADRLSRRRPRGSATRT